MTWLYALRQSRAAIPRPRCSVINQLCRRRLSAETGSAAAQSTPQVYRPTLNISDIYNNLEKTFTNARQRDCAPSVEPDRFAQAYRRSKELTTEIGQLRAERNVQSRQMAQLMKQQLVKEAEELAARGRQLKARIEQLETEEAEIDAFVRSVALRLPNATHSAVPIGPEENATVLNTVGQLHEQPTMADGRAWLDHVTLGERWQLFNFAAAARTSGSNYYYLQREAALLELALIQWAMQRCSAHGFTPILTPDVVRTSVASACGFRPRDDEASQSYLVYPEHEIHGSADQQQQQPDPHRVAQQQLSATAEIPLAGLLMNETLREPQRFVAFGRCFRAEAGGRGRENRGLYRVHQFSKVEMFVATSPQHSDTVLEELRTIQESLLNELGLTYRVLDMPTEELGASAYRKYDIECWMPGRGEWGEVTSTSNCTDYQSRRLNIRWRPSPKERSQFAHTLNGTACAIPRIIVALLETNQLPDGRIRIPQVLRPWLNQQEFIGGCLSTESKE